MLVKLDKIDPTKYIRNYWNATQRFTREKALYRAINKTIISPKNTKELLRDLDDLAEYYHDMVSPSDGLIYKEELKKAFIALKMLKASTFYPVVLAMKKQGSYDEDDVLKVVKVIECYIFRNFTICRKTANSTETFFADVAKRIYDESLSSVSDICSDIRKGIVSDDEFKESFKIWTGTKSNKDTIRYILRNIHKYLDASNELNIDNTEVHIEHIMPEDNSKWDVDNEIHDTYLWRLGNLCLLSGPLNISISNNTFAEKRDTYMLSKIEPNKSIADNDEWNVETIENRQKLFSDYATEIWKK